VAVVEEKTTVKKQTRRASPDSIPLFRRLCGEYKMKDYDTFI
jgi:hypothetical protein